MSDRLGQGLPESLWSWAAYDGVPLLRTLARAMCELERQGDLDHFTLPYPAAAQHALDRTAAVCLLRGERPPASLAELVERCRSIPLEDWPLRLPPDTVGPGDHLLDEWSGRPNELCHEWVDRGPDPALRHRDRQVIRTALVLCRQYGEEQTYSAFRSLLVRQPVLTAAGMFEVLGNMVLEPVHELIRMVYLPAPDAYVRDGAYRACGRCLTLLVPLGLDEWWCERDRCRGLGAPPPGQELEVAEVGTMLQLERSLRQFVTGPGRAEVELDQDLRALGLDVVLWPGYDAYDLLINFPDGHRWAVDVKDRANPYLLGGEAEPVPQEPPYDEAYWVVPRHRVDTRPDYLAAFERGRAESAAELVLLTDTDLVARAALRLGGTIGAGGA
ncbi:hypothetical protein [Kitasatospora brasiliensis]|uniref:pPIWI_RE_Y domain-containing protein n=1 Tax=Kitasatospora brasiliensis TaxID=3058040 RepID=UPI00293017EA|nr:hypothetical protein [Kitasatospora sp. K002]